MGKSMHSLQCATVAVGPVTPSVPTQTLNNFEMFKTVSKYANLRSTALWAQNAVGGPLSAVQSTVVLRCDVRPTHSRRTPPPQCHRMRRRRTSWRFSKAIWRSKSRCPPPSPARSRTHAHNCTQSIRRLLHLGRLTGLHSATSEQHAVCATRPEARHALQVRKRTQETLEMEIDAGVETNFSFRLDVLVH